MQLVEGGTETKDQSTFIGYSAEVYSTNQVQKYYDALRLFNPDATHIMCAFRLLEVNVETSMGAIDDGEHGGARTLLNLLNKGHHVNKALFVIRHYGGQHIGAARFQLIEKVASTALTKLEEQIRSARQPLTQAELQELNNTIRQQELQKLKEQEELKKNPWYTPDEEDA